MVIRSLVEQRSECVQQSVYPEQHLRRAQCLRMRNIGRILQGAGRIHKLPTGLLPIRNSHAILESITALHTSSDNNCMANILAARGRKKIYYGSGWFYSAAVKRTNLHRESNQTLRKSTIVKRSCAAVTNFMNKSYDRPYAMKN